MAGNELNQKAIAKTIGDVIAERDALRVENDRLRSQLSTVADFMAESDDVSRAEWLGLEARIRKVLG